MVWAPRGSGWEGGRGAAFQMQCLSEAASAALVVEGRYPALFKIEHVSGAWLADMLARLQVRYPEVPVVFADSRKFGEERKSTRLNSSHVASSYGVFCLKEKYPGT